MTRARHHYISDRLRRLPDAQAYAADARARNPKPHHCEACAAHEMLPAVQRILDAAKNRAAP